MTTPSFLSGVVEGFYGRPWNPRQRHLLFGWMRSWGLNTYLYAPKDDLKHRAHWRQPYPEIDAAELGALIRDAQRHGLNFIYAFSPGLDIRYAAKEDLEFIQAKLSQILDLGGRQFAILFDDIPGEMSAEDAARFPSVAHAQCAVANATLKFLRSRAAEARLLFCPTAYCGRMASQRPGYLPALGKELDSNIDVLWTGPQIVSETISVESLREVSAWLGRKPVLWDNLYANDYDVRRVYLGPYSGRPQEGLSEVSGILVNPNCQFELNFVPVRTFAQFLSCQSEWRPREAYRAALDEWLPLFAAEESGGLTVEDLEWLGDLFYLPHELGNQARDYLKLVQSLFSKPPAAWGDVWPQCKQMAGRISDLYVKVGLIKNRELFFALSPLLWELKEEIALDLGYLEWLRTSPSQEAGFVSADHAPKTYRGGFVAELQRLLPMDDGGRFRHSAAV